MFKIDDKDLKRLETDLKNFAGQALPYATRNTLNGAAFDARKNMQQNIRDDLVTRNKFTERSVRVQQTRQLNIRRQKAFVGSIAGYMEIQEFGGTIRRKGSEGVPIPTSYSAGQPEGAQPRTKLPRKPNRLLNIQLQKRAKRGRSRQQQNLIAVKEAAASGHKYVFLDLGRRKGIFRVLGGKRRPRVKMVHDLSNSTITVTPTPTLGPAVRTTEKKIPVIYKKSLEFQAKRNKMFGYR